MKKGFFGGIALLAAAAAMGSTELDPSGQLSRTYVGNIGNDPKSYGQWLQQAGRQKWVKAKRRAA